MDFKTTTDFRKGNDRISLKMQRPASATEIKRDYRSLRSKVTKILKEHFFSPPRKKPPLPFRQKSEIVTKFEENRDSYKQIHIIEESFKKSRKSEFEVLFKKRKSLPVGFPNYIDMKISPHKSMSSLDEAEYANEKYYQEQLPNVEKLCKFLNAEEIERISMDPQYFIATDAYKDFAPLADPKKWDYWAGLRSKESSETKPLSKAFSNERPSSSNARKRIASATPTGQKPSGAFFRAVREGEKSTMLDAETKKDIIIFKNVEYLKADRERKLERQKQRLKIESYREAERIGVLLEKFDFKMKRAETIFNMIDKSNRKTILTSQQKLDDMHIFLERTKKNCEEDSELKRINYSIKKNLTEKTTAKNKEQYITDKINRNHWLSRFGERNQALAHE